MPRVLLASGLLLAIVVLAIVSTRVVGRRAARTVDQVTALLERNEARFRAMVRDSNDIMAIVDPHGRLVYASPVTERILGLDIEPLIGTDVFDLIHPEDRDRARRGLQFTRDGKEGAERVELRLRRADGTWRVVEAVATNLLDDPSVEGIVISARDLTDRRHAEAELREAQERFRSAFEHAPIGMALISTRRPAVPCQPRPRADPRTRRVGAARVIVARPLLRRRSRPAVASRSAGCSRV